jgi:purine-nucleoside phosphorylase
MLFQKNNYSAGKIMKNAVDYIKNKIASDFVPEVGLILGSGLGEIADEINGIAIPFSEIPGFKSSGVQGHAGKLVIGELASKKVVAMQGRLHFYEGNTLQEVIFPVRVMKLLGIEKLIVTNAAGGVNRDFSAGDLMIITDHINMLGDNPLIGHNHSFLGERFVDMSYAYCKELVKTAESTAGFLNIKTQKGVYAAMTGPTYETPAEVRMLRALGADAVGMSTVPEVIAASHMKLKVLGISCITNMAAGILDQPLNHEEVIETANRVKKDFQMLVKSVLEKI